jgi:hypothetical protein
MRDLFRKAFIPSALLLAIGYPAYIAYDVVASGSIDEQCTRSGRGGVGVFCEWGPQLGAALFGPERAHLGYAILIGSSALVMLAFLTLALLGSSRTERT